MIRRVRFRPEAEAEATNTHAWYEGRQAGLGAEFRSALQEAIDRIINNPLQFPIVHRDTRRALLKRFPYAAYFRVDGDDVVVLAIHGRQDPRRWRSRK